jgi:hypothetical protein
MDRSGRLDIAPLQYVEQILAAEPATTSAGFALDALSSGPFVKLVRRDRPQIISAQA